MSVHANTISLLLVTQMLQPVHRNSFAQDTPVTLNVSELKNLLYQVLYTGLGACTISQDLPHQKFFYIFPS